jgi:Ino eighty subunit 1
MTTNIAPVFPEMRAQLRTYHAIPSLQQQDVSSYKQLQDAPRLKSILKGATEDIEQPGTVEDIMAAKIPRTNPVNLIFVLAQSAPKISGIHFDVPRDFFDLVMKENLSSKSRAVAFLWLMWWYLESDYTAEAALRNPFGPGRHAKENPGPDDKPLRCPPFVLLTEEEALKENVDTQDELDFGELKRLEREAINNGQMPAVYSGPKRSKKCELSFIPFISIDEWKLLPTNQAWGLRFPASNAFGGTNHQRRQRLMHTDPWSFSRIVTVL